MEAVDLLQRKKTIMIGIRNAGKTWRCHIRKFKDIIKCRVPTLCEPFPRGIPSIPSSLELLGIPNV